MRVLRTFLALLIVVQQLSCAAGHREIRATDSMDDPFPEVANDDVLESVQTADSVLVRFGDDGGRYNRENGRVIGMTRVNYGDAMHGKAGSESVVIDIHEVVYLHIRGRELGYGRYFGLVAVGFLVLIVVWVTTSDGYY